MLEQDGPASVSRRNNSILELRVRPGIDHAKRQALLDHRYRARLREQVGEMIAKWEPVLGVNVAAWGMTGIKTRWGTCHIEERRVWLNL